MADGSDAELCPFTKDQVEALGDFALPVNVRSPFASFNAASLGDAASSGQVAYPDSNIICDYDAGTLTATALGMLTFTKGGMVIEPLWHVLADAQTMTMDVYHEDCFNDCIPLATFIASLPEKTRGVDKDALGEAAAMALTEGKPVREVIVVKGREPVPGVDGRIQFKFTQANEAGKEMEDGSIDFRERGHGSTCVQAGEEIAILYGPKRGLDGYDVLGNEFPAEDGQAEVLKAGAGVASSQNEGGQVIFSSTQPGMVVVRDGTIFVSDIMEVASDVDMTTGNVRVGKGSVLVKGTVTTGFEVEAADDVIVDVVVENAMIKAGNDVTVGGGVLMEEGGRIEAGGNVTAKFIRNATIRAGGDVFVEVDMVNCDVIAGGRIIAESDKGVLNGGKYVCAGADVAEIGTDSGVKTTMTILLPEEEDDGLDAREQELKAKIEELEKYIGSDDIKNTLILAPKEDRAILAELFKIKSGFLKALEAIAELKKTKLKEQGEALSKLALKARKTAHAGTTINIGNRSITLNKAEQASKFHWDAEHAGIAIAGL